MPKETRYIDIATKISSLADEEETQFCYCNELTGHTCPRCDLVKLLRDTSDTVLGMRKRKDDE